MRLIPSLCLSLCFMVSGVFAQNVMQGHTDQNKFRQMKDLLATPNETRTASGAPGYQYTQQQVDYVMNIRLDETNDRIYGEESITYHNNSKDALPYLWVQLDQNMRAKDSKTPAAKSDSFDRPYNSVQAFVKNNLEKPFDGGFNLDYVKAQDGSDLQHIDADYIAKAISSR